MVDGARWSSYAIERSERLAASPREISSRSALVSTRDDRVRGRGTTPPPGGQHPMYRSGVPPQRAPDGAQRLASLPPHPQILLLLHRQPWTSKLRHRPTSEENMKS